MVRQESLRSSVGFLCEPTEFEPSSKGRWTHVERVGMEAMASFVAYLKEKGRAGLKGQDGRTGS